MIENRVITEEDRELYIYGLRILCEKLLGILSVLMICLLTGGIFQGSVFYLSYSLLRRYAGGYHAHRFVSCYISSCVAVLLCIVLSRSEYAQLLSLLFMLLGTPVILILSPVEHPARPLELCEKVRYRRLVRLTVISEMLVFTVLYFCQLYSLSFSVGYGFVLLSLLLIVQKISNSRHRS